MLLVRMPVGTARAFVERTRQVVRSGRPLCPLCGEPVDDDGHVCGAPRVRDARPRRAVSSSSSDASRSPRTRPSSRRSAGSASSTSPSPASGPCGTSPTRRWRTGRPPPTWSPRRSGGTSCRTTLLRDGPLGPGMVQLWQQPDAAQDPVDIVPAHAVPPDGWRAVFDGIDDDDQPLTLIHEDSPALRRMAVFDVVVNNADRKGGHVLPRERAVTATASTTASASTSSTSCGRSCGAGGASRWTPPRVAGVDRGARRPGRRPRSAPVRAPQRRRGRGRWPTAATGCSGTAPSPVRRATCRRSRGRSSELYQSSSRPHPPKAPLRRELR